jgi:hypothetical protein
MKRKVLQSTKKDMLRMNLICAILKYGFKMYTQAAWKFPKRNMLSLAPQGAVSYTVSKPKAIAHTGFGIVAAQCS